jgi:Mn2+/Fe2+ NRAMP family transporter
MGDYQNTRTFNIIAWTTCIVMIALTLVAVAATFFPGNHLTG